MVLWETEFFAISVVTGEVECFAGIYIEAETMQQATSVMRRMGLDYLQLTGAWFLNAQEIKKEMEKEGLDVTMLGEGNADRDPYELDKIYEGIIRPSNLVKNMSYDNFHDWLDLSDCREDLMSTLIAFKTEGGLEDYVKIIEIYIKNYDKENGKKGK